MIVYSYIIASQIHVIHQTLHRERTYQSSSVIVVILLKMIKMKNLMGWWFHSFKRHL